MSLFYLAVCALLLGLICAWLAALAQLPFSPALGGLRRVRLSSRFWFAWGMLAPACGSMASLFVIAFGILSGSRWLDDHCLVHPGHPHLCLSHILHNPPGGAPFWALLGLAASGFAWGCWRAGRLWRATRQWVAGAAPQWIDEQQVWQVAGSLPIAFTAGLWTPRLYWTQKARDLLGDSDRRIVLIHEGEHQRRRDPLRLLLLEWRRAWLPGGGQVLRHWERQAEIECDQACLKSGFDPGEVASTILKLQKAVNRSQRRKLSLAYARHDAQGLRLRVEALFEQPQACFGTAPAGVLLGLLATLLLSRFGQAHHLLETVLGWLR